MKLSKKDFILALTVSGQESVDDSPELLAQATHLAGLVQFASPEEKAELLDWLLAGVETALDQLPAVHAKLLEERNNV